MRTGTNSRQGQELERVQAPAPASEPMAASPVLTTAEAARWLRLDDGVDTATARRAVFKLCTDGKLRPLKIGRRRLFTVAELTRFIDAESGAPDAESGSGDE